MIDTTKYPSAKLNKNFFIADSYLTDKKGGKLRHLHAQNPFHSDSSFIVSIIFLQILTKNTKIARSKQTNYSPLPIKGY